MKLNKIILLSGIFALSLVACTPDSYDLKEPGISGDDLVEGIAFSITHDTSNPNIVYLKSLLPASYQVAWETPQGRAVGDEFTMKIAFDGDYEVRMGVDTQGGYVWSKPAAFHIEDFCTDFVDNFLWTRLSGGVGQSKTWQLDLALLDDGSAKTTFWKGPHWFWNVNFTWDKLHSKYETETAYANYINSVPWESADAIDPTPAEPDALGGVRIGTGLPITPATAGCAVLPTTATSPSILSTELTSPLRMLPVKLSDAVHTFWMWIITRFHSPMSIP